jgi:stage V sporulation protein AC
MKIEKNEDYKKVTDKYNEKSPVFKNSLFAFLTGGFLCFLGELLSNLYRFFGASGETSYILVTVTFIVLASLATAFGFFDKIARFAGAGTLVPVTGFSNAVTSAAIDNRSEGFILGVGAKIFSVAGPVILFSTLSGTVFGIIYYFYLMVFK